MRRYCASVSPVVELVGVDNVLCLLGCNQVLHRTREDRGSHALGRKSLVLAEGTAEVAIPFQYN